MNAIELLNRVTGRIVLGDTTIEARSWAYSQHLADNVPHRHTYFEVCLVGRWGSGKFLVDGVPHPLVPGTLFIARPGMLHQIVNTTAPQMELSWVCFQWDSNAGAGSVIAPLLSAFAQSPTLSVKDDLGSFGAMWQALRTAAEAALPQKTIGPGTIAQLRALMSALLLAIIEAGGNPPPSLPLSDFSGTDSSQAIVRRAVRFIHNNLHRPLSVVEVAGDVGLSERQLTRLFARFAGAAPAAYIMQARIDRAAALLLRTDDPIKQIAALVGHDDIHTFTRTFTRLTGCPPGRFREQGGSPVAHGASPEREGKLVW